MQGSRGMVGHPEARGRLSQARCRGPVPPGGPLIPLVAPSGRPCQLEVVLRPSGSHPSRLPPGSRPQQQLARARLEATGSPPVVRIQPERRSREVPWMVEHPAGGRCPTWLSQQSLAGVRPVWGRLPLSDGPGPCRVRVQQTPLILSHQAVGGVVPGD